SYHSVGIPAVAGCGLLNHSSIIIHQFFPLMSIRWIPTYNAPVVLTFALMALGVHLADAWAGGTIAPAYFAALPEFDYKSVWSWFRLVSHVLGHKDMAHLASNFAVILLIGSVLEEKHGGKPLAVMIFATALITG